jgi:WD40 repeat protein
MHSHALALAGSVRLWDITGSLINKWESNTAAVASVAFSPSGRHILNGSRDKSVAVYSNLTLQEVGRWVGFLCDVAVCMIEIEDHHFVCAYALDIIAFLILADDQFREAFLVPLMTRSSPMQICESACQSVAASCRNGGVVACGDSAGFAHTHMLPTRIFTPIADL